MIESFNRAWPGFFVAVYRRTYRKP